MYKFLLLLLFGLDATTMHSDVIRPTRQEISRCVPENLQAKINAALVNLEKIGKTVKLLNRAANGSFQKNCKSLYTLLKNLDVEELFDQQNLSKKISKNKKKLLINILKNPDEVWKKYLSYLNNSDKHLNVYINDLHKLLNKKREITLVDLINKIDLIQIGVLQYLEMFQFLSALDFARHEIKGYDTILLGMQDQLFVINSRLNSIIQITQNLRGAYLNLLDKGDCSGDHIANALGFNHKKRVAIANE